MKQIKIPLTVLLLLPFLLLFSQQNNKLVILHTNDTHSQLEPTAPDAVRYPDMGGYARRLGVINQIRQEEANVLLVDAGDFSQGTPYYNFFKGRVEVQGINKMEYDAVALGNHEFDNGMDTLAAILRLAKFPLVVSNYDVSESAIAEFVKPYLVVEKGGIRIGIFALGAELKGLVMEEQYKGVKYQDPVKTVKQYEKLLKKQKKCDVIVCLSHLGSDSTSTKVNDFQVAKQSEYVDVFIGGHSHTLLENVKTSNAKGKPVLIAQMGKSGLFLGRVDLYLAKD
ncbi:Trifunctional nucleotide phosphoesterase protein YfkN [bioreactor metagenome]|jgi:5'-nucleotidase|uniref:Trifunctional nucleotide phosphoesterase protein YfkN n=1 Tax=bioreactor metagenome TaxID=1076179 RepID=A0A644Z3I3_9ZZZZ|nr:metallophosphatase [Paludibacter sp.]